MWLSVYTRRDKRTLKICEYTDLLCIEKHEKSTETCLCNFKVTYDIRSNYSNEENYRQGREGLVGYRVNLAQRPGLPITAQDSNTWQFVLFNSFFWEQSVSVRGLWVMTEELSGALVFTPQEVFFRRCMKCFVFEVWLELLVILSHLWRVHLLANFGDGENCILLLCLRMMQSKTWRGGKGAIQHKQSGASWLSMSTFPG